MPASVTQPSCWCARRWPFPFALYLFAAAVGLLAAVTVIFPTNEASAYYVAVARNLAEGRGLVIDSMWSYATPPLVLPRPAFELWQPLASFIAALPMAVFGSSFLTAQLGGVLVGAAVAPLTWAITRDTAPHVGTPAERVEHLAIGAGIVVSLLAPLLLAVAVPDSTLSFLVFGTLACWLAPRALSRGWRWGLALGVALGLTYLSRHEAVYIGAIFLGVAVVRREGWRQLSRRLAPVVVGGAIVVVPWLLRNVAVFGTPLPGQALDNAFLTGNEQIFDYGARPSLAGFMAQGWWPIAVHIIVAGTHNLFDVTLLPGGPVTVIGALGAFVLARRGRLSATPLAYLLGSGVLTMLVATYIFPVASLWGTFRHAAGPLIVGLTVAAVLVADRAVDGIRRRRAWQRRNAWLAPLALSLLVLPITLLQLTFISERQPGGRIARQRDRHLPARAARDRRRHAARHHRPADLAEHGQRPAHARPACPAARGRPAAGARSGSDAHPRRRGRAVTTRTPSAADRWPAASSSAPGPPTCRT